MFEEGSDLTGSCRFFYLKKSTRSQLVPNLRSVLLGIAFVLVHFAELVGLLAGVSHVPNVAYGYAGVVFILLFQTAFFCAWVERIRKRSAVNEIGVHE